MMGLLENFHLLFKIYSSPFSTCLYSGWEGGLTYTHSTNRTPCPVVFSWIWPMGGISRGFEFILLISSLLFNAPLLVAASDSGGGNREGGGQSLCPQVPVTFLLFEPSSL